MPDVHFEVIRLEDIGKDIIKTTSPSKPTYRSTAKLSHADVENLKHYLNRYDHPSSSSSKKVTEELLFPDSNKHYATKSSYHHHHHHHHHPQDYVDITDDFYSEKLYTELNKPLEYTQPLADIYRYHHHYRRHNNHHTKQTHEKLPSSTLPGDYQTLALEFASCGMKKNTRLPVPYENFSLTDGCFGDDSGFTMRADQQNFLGKILFSRQMTYSFDFN